MKRIWFLLKQSVKFILRLVYGFISGGEICLVCGKRTFVYPVCKSCLNKRFSVTEINNIPRCKYCGKELISTNGDCFQCREETVIKSVDKMIPLFSYRLWNKELMFMWKSQEIRSISNMFAGILNKALKMNQIEFIVPVPPRPGKIQEKGWDQIEELCNLLEFKYGFKVLRFLERKTVKQQKKLDREGRLNQIGKAYFSVDQSRRNKILERYGINLPDEVCLLDDVCTTGSTLTAAIHLFKGAGVKKIKVLVIASFEGDRCKENNWYYFVCS